MSTSTVMIRHILQKLAFEYMQLTKRKTNWFKSTWHVTFGAICRKRSARARQTFSISVAWQILQFFILERMNLGNTTKEQSSCLRRFVGWFQPDRERPAAVGKGRFMKAIFQPLLSPAGYTGVLMRDLCLPCWLLRSRCASYILSKCLLRNSRGRWHILVEILPLYPHVAEVWLVLIHQWQKESRELRVEFILQAASCFWDVWRGKDCLTPVRGQDTPNHSAESTIHGSE